MPLQVSGPQRLMASAS